MIGYIDAPTGAAGDKTVGALLQCAERLGLCTREEFAEKFEGLVPGIAIEIDDGIDNGISGLRMHVGWKDGHGDGPGHGHHHGPGHAHMHVDANDDAHEHVHGHGHHEHGHGEHEHGDGHHHHHGHDHGHRHHDHAHHDDQGGEHSLHEHRHAHHHGHEGGHQHDHGHGSWGQIKQMIEGWEAAGDLTEGAACRALGAFELVASAESRVHGTTMDDVHFHEVGAIDSIVDTVGASHLMDLIGIDELYARPIVTGFGTVDCAHGTLPVPAPATALLLEGVPFEQGLYEGEMTTPTGAALLHWNVTGWAQGPAIVPRAVGYGLGTRSIPGTSNCLRLIVGDRADDGRGAGAEDGFAVERCALLQANIDHISPEQAATCIEDLMDAGALDAWIDPITMKKGRAAMEFNVLARIEDLDALAKKASVCTGSLGIRRTIVERTVAPRSIRTVDTEFGPVAFKAMEAMGAEDRPLWIRPEHDEVRRISKETGLPYAEVRRRLMDALA